jgi:peptidoglycan/xylan/chitin deacetylase (PgdA/CDA1 family)
MPLQPRRAESRLPALMQRSMRENRIAVACIMAAALYVAGGSGALAEGSPAKPAWQLSDRQVQALASRVRAGRDLTPRIWPEDARVAVLLSFDVDTETLAFVYGGARITELSQGEYGARVGLKRILEVLDRYHLPASFFIPGVSLMLHPEIAGLIRQPGRHEIGVHGWIHEPPNELSRDEQRRLLGKAVDLLARQTGERPRGHRAPSWIFSEHTLDLVREFGFQYDSSLMADDRPYELLAAGEPTGVVELPVSWILDDYPVLSLDAPTHLPPREVLEIYIAEFERAYAEGTMFLLTMHPQIIGRRSRIGILEDLIEHIRERRGVWFATHRAAVQYVREQAQVAKGR